MYQKSSNELITFLFIGQGQNDTWHHLRGLPDASSSRNLEKIHFRTSLNNFAWWCEMENPSAAFSFCWSISHDCAKISHGHAKSLFTWSFEITFHMVMRNHFSHFPYVLQPSLFCFISHGHVKLKNMLFRLLFAIYLIYFSWFHFNYLQINSKSQSKPIALLLSLWIWIIIKFICFLQFD